jgi:hypothetical protein
MKRSQFLPAILAFLLLAAALRPATPDLPAAAPGPRLGANAGLGGKQVFPVDKPWNRDHALATLRRVRGSDFEVVRIAGITVGREGD